MLLKGPKHLLYRRFRYESALPLQHLPGILQAKIGAAERVCVCLHHRLDALKVEFLGVSCDPSFQIA